VKFLRDTLDVIEPINADDDFLALKLLF